MKKEKTFDEKFIAHVLGNIRNTRSLLIKYTEWLNNNGYLEKNVIDYELAEHYLISTGEAYCCGHCTKMHECKEPHDKFTLACDLIDFVDFKPTPDAAKYLNRIKLRKW